ncbi:MAG TPA: hypothetical protein VGL25_15010 [Casimicrobiaceae bacterium]|jgi:hypothetical protein
MKRLIRWLVVGLLAAPMAANADSALARLLRSRLKGKGTPLSSGIGLRGWLATLGVLCVLGVPGLAYAAEASSTSKPPTGQTPLVKCNQKYALCATAQCFYLNGVAYCKCNVKQGESISITFEFDDNDNTQDVCDLLDQGLNNGYTVSTFSLPDQVTKKYAAEYPPNGGPPPPLALYTCHRGSSTGPYAQCDGGVCFNSTSGTTFPGVGAVGDNQIICSCPVTDPRKVGPQLGYQISGPWKRADGTACGANDSPSDCCSSAYLNQFCDASYGSVIPTGATIPVGAPTGAATALAALLGDLRPINTCFER